MQKIRSNLIDCERGGQVQLWEKAMTGALLSEQIVPSCWRRQWDRAYVFSGKRNRWNVGESQAIFQAQWEV